MSKPRQCPHCRYVLPVDSGFYFDKMLNMICGKCDKVIYPAAETSESQAHTTTVNQYSSTGCNNNISTYPGYSGSSAHTPHSTWQRPE